MRNRSPDQLPRAPAVTVSNASFRSRADAAATMSSGAALRADFGHRRGLFEVQRQQVDFEQIGLTRQQLGGRVRRDPEKAEVAPQLEQGAAGVQWRFGQRHDDAGPRPGRQVRRGCFHRLRPDLCGRRRVLRQVAAAAIRIDDADGEERGRAGERVGRDGARARRPPSRGAVAALPRPSPTAPMGTTGKAGPSNDLT